MYGFFLKVCCWCILLSPSPSFVLQGPPIFRPSSNQVNNLWYATGEYCLRAAAIMRGRGRTDTHKTRGGGTRTHHHPHRHARGWMKVGGGEQRAHTRTHTNASHTDVWGMRSEADVCFFRRCSGSRIVVVVYFGGGGGDDEDSDGE